MSHRERRGQFPPVQGGAGVLRLRPSVDAQLTIRRDELTIREREGVDAPVDARLLITAGPGTGKTYVLIRRLARLVAEERLSAAQELLALSFSRNAVKNIRDRVMSMSPAVRYIRVSTFDSFAS